MHSQVLAVCLLCLLNSMANAGVVYELINGAAGPQGGRHVSGHLQFSTICGTSCDASHLTEWGFTIRNGTDVFSASSSDIGAVRCVNTRLR